MSRTPAAIGTSRTCTLCRQLPLTEYQPYCHVSRSNSQRKPWAAVRLPSGPSAMISTLAGCPSGSASSPAGERSPIASGRRPIDRERFAGADRAVAGRQRHLELRRHEILDPDLGAADRRRFRVELQLDPPGADPRVARHPDRLGVAAELAAGQLATLHLDPVG